MRDFWLGGVQPKRFQSDCTSDPGFQSCSPGRLPAAGRGNSSFKFFSFIKGMVDDDFIVNRWTTPAVCGLVFSQIMNRHNVLCPVVVLPYLPAAHGLSHLALASAIRRRSASSNGSACKLLRHACHGSPRFLMVKSPSGLFLNSKPISGQLAVGCFGSGPGGQIVYVYGSFAICFLLSIKHFPRRCVSCV